VQFSTTGNHTPYRPLRLFLRKNIIFWKYAAKYETGASQEICSTRISSDAYKKVQSFAIKARCLFVYMDFSRSDMIVTAKDAYILETNTIPGMTEHSLFPLAARTTGLSFSKLLDRLIDLAFED